MLAERSHRLLPQDPPSPVPHSAARSEKAMPTSAEVPGWRPAPRTSSVAIPADLARDIKTSESRLLLLLLHDVLLYLEGACLCFEPGLKPMRELLQSLRSTRKPAANSCESKSPATPVRETQNEGRSGISRCCACLANGIRCSPRLASQRGARLRQEFSQLLQILEQTRGLSPLPTRQVLGCLPASWPLEAASC